MAQDEAIGSGVDRENNDIPGDGSETDVYAYADDGEHATVWCVARTSDYEVALTAYRCEAGLVDRDGKFGKKYFGVDPDESTEKWAREYAESHKNAGVEIAKEYFN